MLYHFFIFLLVLAIVSFPLGVLFAFESGNWQWLIFPALSGLFFHLTLEY